MQLFLHRPATRFGTPLVIGSNSPVRFDGNTPGQLLDSKAWAWHDTPPAWDGQETALPPGAMTVWTFNSRKLPFGIGGRFEVSLGPADNAWLSTNLVLAAPGRWISAVTFLGPGDSVRPTSLVLHVQNAGAEPLSIRSCRLWLPADPKVPHVLFAQPNLEALSYFGGKPEIPAGDKGGFMVTTAPLPLTCCVVEVSVESARRAPESLWAHLRIKSERFDISGRSPA